MMDGPRWWEANSVPASSADAPGEQFTVRVGDCRAVLRTMAPNSVDSIVTDPPYGLSFMGKGWDHGVPGVEFWAEALRVAKPGAHLLAFGGTRTFHRLMVAIEDAGWEIRDTIMWVYGSGFPKSLDVSKAIDKAAGVDREAVGSKAVTRILNPEDVKRHNYAVGLEGRGGEIPVTAPATDAARQWEGWGTALKPAWEPIIIARKPLEGTVAQNVQKWGVGALNIDGCRVPTDDNLNGGAYAVVGGRSESQSLHGGSGMNQPGKTVGTPFQPPPGRWPANLVHDGSEEVLSLFPWSKDGVATQRNGGGQKIGNTVFSGSKGLTRPDVSYGGEGSAARFFYCAKASKADREEGLGGLRVSSPGERTGGRKEGSAGLQSPRAGAGRSSEGRNHHPTVKPTPLMRYLCRLATPPGGLVLDPFCGSGSTGKGALREGFSFLGIDEDAEYAAIARARCEAAAQGSRPD